MSIVIVYCITIGLLNVSFALVPELSEQTVQFGVRVPPAFVDAPSVRSAQRAYRVRWCVIFACILAACGAVLVLGWWANPGALFGLMAASLLLHFGNFYGARRKLLRAKSDENWYAGYTQSLVADTAFRRAVRAPSLLWALPALVVTLAACAIGARAYASLPAQVAVHFGLNGQPDRWAAKSLWSVFGPFLIVLALTVGLGALHLNVHRLPVRLDASRPAASQARAAALQRATLQSVWVLLAFVALGQLFALLPVWGVAALGVSTAVAVSLSTIAFGVLITLVLLVRAAQTARRVDDSARASVRVQRDDDSFWVGGVFYWNRHDPAPIVPKRFGVGWTVNFAHPVAWLMLLCIVAVPVVIGLLGGGRR
ncbi:MAG: DUF1648 domain-containing protein [Alicyclobacillus sp.]|nr:DUF1648 domain-containing protein [Alicyclobacillus sp.]